MKNKTSAFGVCMLMLVVVFTSGCIEEMGEEGSYSEGDQQSQGSWHFVFRETIQGTGDTSKTTTDFYCKGWKQKMEWSYEGTAEYNTPIGMYVYLTNVTTSNAVGMGGSSSTGSGSDSGINYIDSSPGYYYLDISAWDCSYEIKVYSFY